MRIVLILLLATAALADDVIDQQQSRIDAAVRPLDVGGSPASQQKLAQTVTTGIEGPLVAVQLPVACTSGTLVVEIMSVDGDRPGSTLLGRATVAASALPAVAAGTFREIRLPDRIRMRDGQRFTIVLSNTTGVCSIASSSKGDVYTAGDAFFDARPNPPGWIPSRDINSWFDLPFKTVVDIIRGDPACRTEFGELPFGRSVPVCRCLEDRNLRVQRCALLHPSVFMFRRIPWPLAPGQPFKVQWTLVALTQLQSNLEVSDGLGGSVKFNAARLRPGESATLEYRATAPREDIEARTTFSGAKELTGTMHSTIEVANPPR